MQNLVIFWIVVASLSFIIEINTTAFFAIWFGIAALITLIFNFFGANLTTQIVVFIILSISLILSSEFILKKKLKILKPIIKTNIDSIIGKIGVVTREIKDMNYDGEVLVEGRFWSCISEDGSTIPINTKVIVKGVQGVKLIVKPIEKE